MEFEFRRQSFEKSSNIKFNENLPCGSPVVLCWRTDRQSDGRKDRHDEANNLFSKFCERA